MLVTCLVLLPQINRQTNNPRFQISMLGDTIKLCSQENDPAASAKIKDDPSAAVVTRDMGEAAAPEVGRAFIKSDRRIMTEDFRTDATATTLQADKAATTYLPTRCINWIGVKETHKICYALCIAIIPQLFNTIIQYNTSLLKYGSP